MGEIGYNSGMISLGFSSANIRIFKELRKIERVTLLVNKDIGQSTEVAFVTMDSDDSTENAEMSNPDFALIKNFYTRLKLL